MSGARLSKVPTVLSMLLGTIVIVGVTTVGLTPREAPKKKTPEKISENRPAVKPAQQLQHPVILPPPPTVSAKPAAETPVNGIKKLKSVDVLVGGFPCQAFSVAGYRKGFKDHGINIINGIKSMGRKIITTNNPTKNIFI